MKKWQISLGDFFKVTSKVMSEQEDATQFEAFEAEAEAVATAIEDKDAEISLLIDEVANVKVSLTTAQAEVASLKTEKDTVIGELADATAKLAAATSSLAFFGATEEERVQARAELTNLQEMYADDERAKGGKGKDLNNTAGGGDQLVETIEERRERIASVKAGFGKTFGK